MLEREAQSLRARYIQDGLSAKSPAFSRLWGKLGPSHVARGSAQPGASEFMASPRMRGGVCRPSARIDGSQQTWS